MHVMALTQHWLAAQLACGAGKAWKDVDQIMLDERIALKLQDEEHGTHRLL